MISPKSWPEATLIDQLNQAVKTSGLIPRPGFKEPLMSKKCINLVLADRRNGLVARIRPAKELSPAKARVNLKLVTAAGAAGVPLLAPTTTDVLLLDQLEPRQTATIWPLADNRAVTVSELATVLRQIHDSPPPTGLPRWVDIRLGKLREKVAELKGLPNPPPTKAIATCDYLVEECHDNLQRLMADAADVFVHGDAHPHNIVILDGQPIACDLDNISLGPIEVDLATAFLHSRRYPGMDPQAGEKLAAAYGRPYCRERLEALVDAITLSRTVSLGQFWSEPNSRDSLLQRLEVIRDGGRFARLHGAEDLCPFAPTN